MSTVDLSCEMRDDCRERVTHVGSKGYIYCEPHALQRRQSGAENVRKMTPTERRAIAAGGQIRYRRGTS